MSVSSTVVNLGAFGLAAVTATGLFMVSPFTQDPPSELPPPPMEVICASVEFPDPSRLPVSRLSRGDSSAIPYTVLGERD